MSMGWRDLGSGPHSWKKPWGQVLGRAKFKLGVGPLLRICVEGESQHVERRTSGVWSSRIWS